MIRCTAIRCKRVSKQDTRSANLIESTCCHSNIGAEKELGQRNLVHNCPYNKRTDNNIGKSIGKQ